MSTVKEIEAAISKLPGRDLWRLKAHLDRLCADEWDTQIEKDAQPGGPLDKPARQAIEEFEAGRCTPLP